jgi:tetratricopeptide (TPR) repeat protein
MKILTTLVLAALFAATSPAQDAATAVLKTAEKAAAAAKGKSGDELAKALNEAFAIYETVAKRFPAAKPEIARADLGIGRVKKRLGDLAAAETALKRAADSGESRPAAEALHELATIYRKLKRLPDAAASLERVVAEFTSEPRERADALVRLGGLRRSEKKFDEAETALRRVLSEHGDLLTPSLEALDDLVALKLAADKDAEATELLDAHGAALKARFSGGKQEARLLAALDRMRLRIKRDAGDTGGGGGEGGD